MKTSFKKSKQKGFTLVEAMVAISILSLAVTGPLLIAQKGVGSAIYARDQITSFYLAQEAVEYIRNVRDSNRISKPENATWLYQFDVCKVDNNNLDRKCKIDAQLADFNAGGAITACPAEGCPVILFDTINGIYGYSLNSQPTIFTRTISIDDRASQKEAMISVTISWKTNLFDPIRKFTIQEYIFDF